MNALYGEVNRTGLVVAGAALLGVSGYALLNEMEALPSPEGMARAVRNMQAAMENWFRVNVLSE